MNQGNPCNPARDKPSAVTLRALLGHVRAPTARPRRAAAVASESHAAAAWAALQQAIVLLLHRHLGQAAQQGLLQRRGCSRNDTG